ncbi:hypothetical protein GCM10011322_13670 [Salinarimonas ramus]|uniref:Uncharacterized protein n=1 Tax=Salinarimonas ramus TaxID=690164 RepID=A0A917V2I0_9HYPH|nr:hypothetical protein GCM10011322_13670 [Salinarimonas ramus]
MLDHRHRGRCGDCASLLARTAHLPRGPDLKVSFLLGPLPRSRLQRSASAVLLRSSPGGERPPLARTSVLLLVLEPAMFHSPNPKQNGVEIGGAAAA